MAVLGAGAVGHKLAGRAVAAEDGAGWDGVRAGGNGCSLVPGAPAQSTPQSKLPIAISTNSRLGHKAAVPNLDPPGASVIIRRDRHVLNIQILQMAAGGRRGGRRVGWVGVGGVGWSEGRGRGGGAAWSC